MHSRTKQEILQFRRTLALQSPAYPHIAVRLCTAIQWVSELGSAIRFPTIELFFFWHTINFLFNQSDLHSLAEDCFAVPIQQLQCSTCVQWSWHRIAHHITIVHAHQLQKIATSKKSRVDVQKNAFSRVGAKIWNEMPNSFTKISRKTFRKKVKGALLNILKTEDNYIDNNKIIARLKKY